MGSISKTKRTDSVAYRVSKAGVNMYSKVLQNRIADTQKIVVIHPGFVQTTISKHNVDGTLTPEESAQRIYDFISSDFESGTYWDVEGQQELDW